MRGVIIADPRGGLVGVHVWDGTAWKRSRGDADGTQHVNVTKLAGATAYGNTIPGFKATYHEEIEEDNAASGAPTLSGLVVPIGELWVVQAIHATCAHRVVRVAAHVRIGTTEVYIFDKDIPSAGEYAMWTGEVWLAEGQYIRCYYITTTAGDDIGLGLHGYKFDLN